MASEKLFSGAEPTAERPLNRNRECRRMGGYCLAMPAKKYSTRLSMTGYQRTFVCFRD